MRVLLKIGLVLLFILSINSCARFSQNICYVHNEKTGVITRGYCTPHFKNNYSNKKYKVYGKTYHVLVSSKNYEEKGNASWYGKRFHKRRTFSGERYNMNQLSAAHRTLPMNTRVEVTNLLNGRKVIVRVNDRGPFVNNRLIDLSYRAAKNLGMVGHGVVPVKVKSLA